MFPVYKIGRFHHDNAGIGSPSVADSIHVGRDYVVITVISSQHVWIPDPSSQRYRIGRYYW